MSKMRRKKIRKGLSEKFMRWKAQYIPFNPRVMIFFCMLKHDNIRDEKFIHKNELLKSF